MAGLYGTEEVSSEDDVASQSEGNNDNDGRLGTAVWNGMFTILYSSTLCARIGGTFIDSKALVSQLL